MMLAFENEFAKFYVDNTTFIIENHCIIDYGNGNPPLENCRAFIGERRTDGYKTFILYQGDTPIYANPQLEAMGAHIDMLRFNLKR